jgi:hypothetical protein
LNLRDGVLAVRNRLGEIQPEFWSDDEIIQDLNVSARRMCSAAQSLMSFGTFNTSQTEDGSYAQEYILPVDVDQITGASYYSGVLFPLVPVNQNAVQLGGRVSGIPWYFYERKWTKVLTPQLADGTIGMQPFPPNQSNNARTVIGLYPIPDSPLPIYIWYLQFHPDLKFAYDEVQIPDRFKQAWIAYAVARGKEKESAIEEAQYFDAQHEKGTQDFIDYMITNGQEISSPTYSNRQTPPYFLRGASTVLVVTPNPTSKNM